MPFRFALLLCALLITARLAEGKVLILGGGLAGLQAAQTLKDNGVDFLLLEGSDHVGGRLAAAAIDEVAADSFSWTRDTTPGGDPFGPWFQKCNLDWSEPGTIALTMINDTGADITSVTNGRLGELYSILTEAARAYDNGDIPGKLLWWSRLFFF